MISLAAPRAIAGKIARAHNRRTCDQCHRPYPRGGVLAFGLSGSDPRWYPNRETAERQTPGIRYIYPVSAKDVSPEDVEAWLEEVREDIERLVEYAEQLREQRRVQRAVRENELRVSTWPCDSCGWAKHRPADRCDRCGDEPCPIGIDPHEYNRARGYAS